MELLQLIYFSKVAELEHMTNAAKELHLAQPALSKAVKSLEKELNVALFDRIGKRIYLNNNGKIVQKYAQNIFSNVKDMKAEIADTNQQLKKSLIIAMKSAAAYKNLPDLIFKFEKQYPDIKIIIQQSYNPANFNQADIIMHATKEKPCNPNSVILLKEEILLALSYNHPLATKESISLNEVRDETFISMQKNTSLRKMTDEYCNLAGFEPRVILESDDLHSILELIQIGMGMSFIPDITWGNISNSKIKLLKINQPSCYRYITISWKNNTYMSTSAKLFRDFCIEYFADLRNKK